MMFSQVFLLIGAVYAVAIADKEASHKAAQTVGLTTGGAKAAEVAKNGTDQAAYGIGHPPSGRCTGVPSPIKIDFAVAHDVTCPYPPSARFKGKKYESIKPQLSDLHTNLAIPVTGLKPTDLCTVNVAYINVSDDFPESWAKLIYNYHEPRGDLPAEWSLRHAEFHAPNGAIAPDGTVQMFAPTICTWYF